MTPNQQFRYLEGMGQGNNAPQAPQGYELIVFFQRMMFKKIKLVQILRNI